MRADHERWHRRPAVLHGAVDTAVHAAPSAGYALVRYLLGRRRSPCVGDDAWGCGGVSPTRYSLLRGHQRRGRAGASNASGQASPISAELNGPPPPPWGARGVSSRTQPQSTGQRAAGGHRHGNRGAADLEIPAKSFSGPARGRLLRRVVAPVVAAARVGRTCSLWVRFAPHLKEEAKAKLVLAYERHAGELRGRPEWDRGVAAAGAPGAAGAGRSQRADGTNGANGTNGKNGTNGADGQAPAGATGQLGAVGPRGPKGDPASVSPARRSPASAPRSRPQASARGGAHVEARRDLTRSAQLLSWVTRNGCVVARGARARTPRRGADRAPGGCPGRLRPRGHDRPHRAAACHEEKRALAPLTWAVRGAQRCECARSSWWHAAGRCGRLSPRGRSRRGPPAGSAMRTRPWRASPAPRATTRPLRVTVIRAARTRDVTASLSVHRTRTRLRRTLARLQLIVAPVRPAPGSPFGPRGPAGPADRSRPPRRSCRSLRRSRSRRSPRRRRPRRWPGRPCGPCGPCGSDPAIPLRSTS